jgi:putative transposase
MAGLRFDNDKGRYVNDKTHLSGRECIPVKEYDTSRTCWRCGSQNTSREVQNQWECHDRGLEDNGDKNGATNIGKRAVGNNIQRPLSTVGLLWLSPKRRSYSREHTVR